jgi:rod shape-determining protein MreC
VITGTSATLPSQAQADAAQAEATAEENKRAAEVLAEKLPNVTDQPAADPNARNGAANAAASNNGKPIDTTGQNLVGGLPGVPNSGLPKVKPSLHPDRYTPGATPPASDLQPGAPAPKNSSQNTQTSTKPEGP